MNDVFRALSDPTRREILELLRDGPRTSGEIAEKFTTSWATVSRHLSVLKDAELILAERDGQHVVYELNTTVFQDVVEHLIKWLGPGRKNA
ncbi:MAG: autorepressor SdpR family transcription factor [Gemmatimonadaceae bacterium]